MFHDPANKDDDIQQLRRLHAELDRTVADAYGWSDLDLGHGFHQTRLEVRFTLSDTARRLLLDRTLRLNHEQYTAEVAAGDLEKSKKPKGLKKKRTADVQ